MLRVLLIVLCLGGLPACGNSFPPGKTSNDCSFSGGVLGGVRYGDDCRFEDRKDRPVIFVTPLHGGAPGFLGISGKPPCSDYTGCAPTFHDGTVGRIPSVPAGCGGVGANCGFFPRMFFYHDDPDSYLD